MARFHFLKPNSLKSRGANSTILKLKAFRIAVGACVFCFALGTGLFYPVVQTAQNEQLVVLGDSSGRMAEALLKRLTNLDAEARDVAVDRVDILDVTYLGRFTGIPNGALTGGRVDPSFCTRGERRRVRRVVSAIYRIVRLVIGQMNSSVEAIVQ